MKCEMPPDTPEVQAESCGGRSTAGATARRKPCRESQSRKARAGKNTRSSANHDGDQDNQAERTARTEINVLEAVEAPGADHQIADHDDHHEPAHRGPPGSRSALRQRSARPRQSRPHRPESACPQNTSSQDVPDSKAADCLVMLKRARRLAPAIRKAKQAIDPSCVIFRCRSGAMRRRQQMEAPHPGQQRRSNAEGDDVGQRIEFPAEIAVGVGHARDAAVEAVEQYGKTDRHGGEVQVPGLRRQCRGRSAEWRRIRPQYWRW